MHSSAKALLLDLLILSLLAPPLAAQTFSEVINGLSPLPTSSAPSAMCPPTKAPLLIFLFLSILIPLLAAYPVNGTVTNVLDTDDDNSEKRVDGNTVDEDEEYRARQVVEVAVDVKVDYNQKQSIQDATISFSDFGKREFTSRTLATVWGTPSYPAFTTSTSSTSSTRVPISRTSVDIFPPAWYPSSSTPTSPAFSTPNPLTRTSQTTTSVTHTVSVFSNPAAFSFGPWWYTVTATSSPSVPNTGGDFTPSPSNAAYPTSSYNPQAWITIDGKTYFGSRLAYQSSTPARVAYSLGPWWYTASSPTASITKAPALVNNDAYEYDDYERAATSSPISLSPPGPVLVNREYYTRSYSTTSYRLRYIRWWAWALIALGITGLFLMIAACVSRRRRSKRLARVPPYTGSQGVGMQGLPAQ